MTVRKKKPSSIFLGPEVGDVAALTITAQCCPVCGARAPPYTPIGQNWSPLVAGATEAGDGAPALDTGTGATQQDQT